MIPNLVVSAMYAEMSRGFINQELEFERKPNLETTDDIPEIVKINIKYTQFAGAIIFRISSLEAYINFILNEIVTEVFNINIFNGQPNFINIKENINEIKEKYSDDTDKEELFKKLTLTKIINKLYRCFELPLLSESSIKLEQKLWSNLVKLQSIRNELIHPKPDFIESDDFEDFFNQSEKEFKAKLLTPEILRLKLFEDTPLYQPNVGGNNILHKYIFKYKADACLNTCF